MPFYYLEDEFACQLRSESFPVKIACLILISYFIFLQLFSVRICREDLASFLFALFSPSALPFSCLFFFFVHPLLKSANIPLHCWGLCFPVSHPALRAQSLFLMDPDDIKAVSDV